MAENTNDKKLSVVKKIWLPLKEVFASIKSGYFPWSEWLFLCSCWELFFILGLNRKIFRSYQLPRLVPFSPIWKILVIGPVLISIWAIGKRFLNQKEQLLKKLYEVFTDSDLKTKTGKYPIFINDNPTDEESRVMKLATNGIKISDFQNAREDLEAQLNIYIDSIEESEKQKGILHIYYSQNALPAKMELPNLEDFDPDEFPLGISRKGKLVTNFQSTPHLLVAGQSGQGKSTYLRTLISILSYNNPLATIYFIDLKGELEGQVFRGANNIKVKGDVESASQTLKLISEEIDARIKLFSANRARDLDEYNDLPSEQRTKLDGFDPSLQLGRIVVVVDEVAELVSHKSSKSWQSVTIARDALVRIARIGRALGVNLVIGVQKPDSASLDQTLKSNLSGVLCFYMANVAASNAAVGSKRATLLPAKIKGRAVYIQGSIPQEVQVPYVTTETIEKFLTSKNPSSVRDLQNAKGKSGETKSKPSSDLECKGSVHSENHMEMENIVDGRNKANML